MAPRLRASIVASGSELVRGDRQDRNGPHLAASLLQLGIDPVRITVVGDEPAELEAALRAGLDEDLLVVSGGLGPTHDDRTIELLARATGRPLAVDEQLAAEIEALSRRVAERLNRPYADFADGVRKQAALPEGAEWVGLVGTAPAVVLDTGACVAVALPGPPGNCRSCGRGCSRRSRCSRCAGARRRPSGASCGSSESRSPRSPRRSQPRAAKGTGWP